MGCAAPFQAWRSDDGKVVLGKSPPRSHFSRSAAGVVSLLSWHELLLPCGSCSGCRLSRGREWSIRCALELQFHSVSCWATLTFDEKHVPPTVQRYDVSAYVKRLRARVHPRQFRFFASGEYGEQFGRPHYHIILFGLPQSEPAIEQAWKFGRVQVDRLEPAAIAYVAGYVSKKAGEEFVPREVVNPETGEVWETEPPFVLMSRRPGIGGEARQFASSWRSTAIWEGSQVKVPRYLHEAWKKQATPEAIEQLAEEKRRFVDAVPWQEQQRRRAAAAVITEVRLKASQSKRRKF